MEYHENRILRSVEHPFMQASLDGELTDQEGRRGILEIKTSNILQPGQWMKWKDRIPDNYYIQVLHYLIVTGWDFVVLRAHLRSDWGHDRRTEVKHYFLERSEVEADLQYLLSEEQKFWDACENRNTSGADTSGDINKEEMKHGIDDHNTAGSGHTAGDPVEQQGAEAGD